VSQPTMRSAVGVTPGAAASAAPAGVVGVEEEVYGRMGCAEKSDLHLLAWISVVPH
jgi:hypothetical protein